MRLISVGKRYGLRRPWVVRDVSQEVAAGRLIRLEGPNGSGKSTLLRITAGVLVPSTGRVTSRPHAGYVPERFPAALAFSAREYLQHMGRIHGLSPAAVRAAVDDWLERPGATDYAQALICALVGSAAGTLVNPPLIRHKAAALLSTIVAVVVAWVSSISPANAALRGSGATSESSAWPTPMPMLAAFALVAVSWGVSCWLAGRRSD